MPAITTPPALPTPFKKGSTFSFALNVPTTVAAGYFRGWEVQAQVRRKGDSSPKGLIGTVLVKYDSQWHELDKILEKKDGVWVQIF